RHLSHELRPMVLDDLGWLAAIEFLAAAVSGRTRIPVDVRSSITQRLPAPVETALYRVVQEALTNAARHSKAAHIVIEIDQELDSLTIDRKSTRLNSSHRTISYAVFCLKKKKKKNTLYKIVT